MGDNDINSPELTDFPLDDIQILILQTPQFFHPELFSDQFFNNNVTLPPQSHAGQQPFPAEEDLSGLLDLSAYTLGNRLDDVIPPPEPQSHAGHQPFSAGEGLGGVLGPSEFNVLGNQPAPSPYPTQVEVRLIRRRHLSSMAYASVDVGTRGAYRRGSGVRPS